MRQGSFRDGFSARPLQEPTKISRTKLGLRIVQGVQRLVSDGKIVATTGHILLDSWKSVEKSSSDEQQLPELYHSHVALLLGPGDANKYLTMIYHAIREMRKERKEQELLALQSQQRVLHDREQLLKQEMEQVQHQIRTIQTKIDKIVCGKAASSAAQQQLQALTTFPEPLAPLGQASMHAASQYQPPWQGEADSHLYSSYYSRQFVAHPPPPHSPFAPHEIYMPPPLSDPSYWPYQGETASVAIPSRRCVTFADDHIHRSTSESSVAADSQSSPQSGKAGRKRVLREEKENRLPNNAHTQGRQSSTNKEESSFRSFKRFRPFRFFR